MNPDKKAALEAAGWRCGSIPELLGMTPDEAKTLEAIQTMTKREHIEGMSEKDKKAEMLEHMISWREDAIGHIFWPGNDVPDVFLESEMKVITQIARDFRELKEAAREARMYLDGPTSASDKHAAWKALDDALQQLDK